VRDGSVDYTLYAFERANRNKGAIHYRADGVERNRHIEEALDHCQRMGDQCVARLYSRDDDPSMATYFTQLVAQPTLRLPYPRLSPAAIGRIEVFTWPRYPNPRR
jgi:hypothetical protein